MPVSECGVCTCTTTPGFFPNFPFFSLSQPCLSFDCLFLFFLYPTLLLSSSSRRDCWGRHSWSRIKTSPSHCWDRILCSLESDALNIWGEPQTYIFLPLPREDLDCRQASPHPVLCSAEDGTQGFRPARRVLYKLGYMPGSAQSHSCPFALVDGAPSQGRHCILVHILATSTSPWLSMKPAPPWRDQLRSRSRIAKPTGTESLPSPSCGSQFTAESVSTVLLPTSTFLTSSDFYYIMHYLVLYT